MAVRVASAFDEFFRNINLSGDHRNTANTRRDHVVELLKPHFTLAEAAFATGSIPHFTALRGHADVDVMVPLHYSKHIKARTPSQVLQAVRNALSGSRTNVRKNGQAVTLYYKTWPNVDIVPVARSVNNRDQVTHYSVPDMNREVWLKSKPRFHSANLTQRASNCGVAFRKAIKMMKEWNRKHSATLQSYHLEALALATFSSSLQEDYPWLMLQFFENAHKLVQAGNLNYLGSTVDDYLNILDRFGTASRLKAATDKARSAWYAVHAHDNHALAITQWRQVLGDRFPSYG